MQRLPETPLRNVLNATNNGKRENKILSRGENEDFT